MGSSSITSELFGPNQSHKSSATGIFESMFPPPSKVRCLFGLIFDSSILFNIFSLSAFHASHERFCCVLYRLCCTDMDYGL